MNRVACMVQKGAEITAEACVAHQTDERCFCIKAVTALQAVGDGEGMTLRDRSNLVTLRGRAAGMYRQPAERRFAGPALRVYNEEIQAKTEIAKPFEAHLLKALDCTGDATPASGPAQEPAATPAPAPISPPAMQPVDVQRCCASVDCFARIGRKSAYDTCRRCRERDIRRSGATPRFCKAEGCKTQLRAPNLSDFCSICTKRHERLGESMGEPGAETVVVKPVEAQKHPGVVDAAVQLADRAFNEALGKVLDDTAYKLYGDPPPPKTLSHEYLLACVQEARRRLIQLDEHFTIITKEQ